MTSYASKSCKKWPRCSGPEHAKFVYLKLHFLKIPVDSVLYNTEHYGMHDDTDDEQSVRCSRHCPSELEFFVLIQRCVLAE